MRPDARAQSAIEVLDHWLQERTGLDRILTQWARANRYAGSGDRAAIADLVYGAVRRLRSTSWVAGHDDMASGRALIHGSALLDGIAPDTLFTGMQHAPEALTSSEVSDQRTLEAAPHAIRYDYPDWLQPHLAEANEADLDALRQRAPLDLRVNTLKADTKQAIAALEADDIAVEPVHGIAGVLRVTHGNRKVARSRAYDQGFVEIQDAGSQRLAALAQAQSGEVILDLCAGGGGKTLALAAAAGHETRILAHDVSDRRLSDLPTRAERAGANVEIVRTDALDAWQGKVDLVFVDAPCSGSGAWRRNPDAKWQLTPDRLQALSALQGDLIQQAATLCSPEGRIVYGTCSLFPVENAAQVTDFLQAKSDWTCLNRLDARPSTGTDGFFGAVVTRSLDSRIN